MTRHRRPGWLQASIDSTLSEVEQAYLEMLNKSPEDFHAAPGDFVIALRVRLRLDTLRRLAWWAAKSRNTEKEGAQP